MRRWSNESRKPLVFELRPVVWLVPLIVVLHALALIPALLLTLPVGWKLLWMAGVLLLLTHELRRWRRFGVGRGIRSLHYVGNGKWDLFFDAGDRARGTLKGGFVHPWLCVLEFRRPLQAVVIPRGALPSEQHRQLRVLLHTAALQAGESDEPGRV